MSLARNLLHDLAAIGATVQPVGEQLILRAGPSTIPADLVRRVREAKSDLITVLCAPDRSGGAESSDARNTAGPAPTQPTPKKSIEARAVEWLDQHPAPSRAGYCASCGKAESLSAVVLPFGLLPGTHAWLHAECWPAWHHARRSEALRALQADAG
jgi:hypothetical protein